MLPFSGGTIFFVLNVVEEISPPEGGAMADDSGHPSVDEMDLGVVMAALADPHRRRVIYELVTAPADVERTCASFELPVSKSSCTYHFRLLRESGLIEHPDYGNRRGVLLRRDDVDERFPGLLSLLAAEARRATKVS
jgi:DNA-binding transcriptional ArsR family regulator